MFFHPFSIVLGCVLVQAVLSLRIKDQPVGSEFAVLSLMERLMGPRAAHFAVSIEGYPDSPNEYQETVKLWKYGPRTIMIQGTSATAVTYGFHYYLKYYLGYHVSWDGDQLSRPPFNMDDPVIDPGNLTLRLLDKYRYYMNVCTFSYSYVWWNWTRWEREIDWMALKGYNFVLAFTATEAVWQQVYLKLGFTQEEIDDHFTGPAFLAWNRMGNIRGGNKLSSHWHQTQADLQAKILKRMRSLGITPILPAFAGHLPVAVKRLFPQANITYAPRWNNFPDKNCCPALLNPSDPLFVKIGSMFINKLKEMFGTNHVYNCDPFNEMNPNTTDPEEIAKYGRSIYSSMKTADDSAVWVLQGWMFKHDNRYWTEELAEALLTSVDVEQLIVLDLQSELNPQYKRLHNYFGRHYIWCMLHNFGGTLGLQGAIPRVKKGLQEARKSENSTMIGVGITMEGINTNYVVYDFVSDLMIDMPKSIEQWVQEYATRRYGGNVYAAAAWGYLMDSVYSYNKSASLHGQYVFNNRPSLKKNVQYWYDPTYVYWAWNSLRWAASRFCNGSNDLLLTDLVDVTRQGLQHKLNYLYRAVMFAYKKKDLTGVKSQSLKFLEALDDMERILGTSKRFLLGIWLEDAKSMASTPLEKHVYEREARNQISLWGPDGEILDYANKQWAGVIKDYFKPRWVQFFKYLTEAVVSGRFDGEGYRTSVSNAEHHFAETYTLYPTKPTAAEHSVLHCRKLIDKWFCSAVNDTDCQGDAVAISSELYTKWVAPEDFQ